MHQHVQAQGFLLAHAAGDFCPLGVDPERLSLQLGLMLRFTEHFFIQWGKLDDAYRLRTGRGGGWRLVAPLAVHMLQTARRVADALFVRLGG